MPTVYIVGFKAFQNHDENMRYDNLVTIYKKEQLFFYEIVLCNTKNLMMYCDSLTILNKKLRICML